MGALMNRKLMPSRTIRWGATTAAVSMAISAVALGIPANASNGVNGVNAANGANGVGGSTGSSSHKSTGASDWADTSWGGDATADVVSQDTGGNYQASQDPGSLFTVDRAIGARGLWLRRDRSGRPLTGQGVSVALLDSGVSPVAGLNGAGKVTYGPDLSIEGNGVLTQQDTYGHGTFLAGIIAGRGTSFPSWSLPLMPSYVQLGVAPDAKLLAMKLATTDGSVDVSQVIASVDWVTQHPVMPDGTRIRVINLSYGTNSTQDYLADPLAAAVENAWHHGIVVVTSAGNDGAENGRLTDPAIDPYVIAVGATDSNSQLNGWAARNTDAASFTEVGSDSRHADLVAPGTSLVSLRAPGSFIDRNNPSGLVEGDASGRLFRGSGTSQSAAVVSGSVALLLQAYPTLTPDQVKFALTSTADSIPSSNPITVGAGTIDLAQALETAGRLTGTTTPAASLRASARQSFARSTGQGSIEAARGGSLLVDVTGADLSGEIDVQGNPWKPAAWWGATSTLTSWSGGKWLGTTWTGDDWLPAGPGLTSNRWSSNRWSSNRWSSADWSSNRWSAAYWSSNRWSSNRWSSNRWSSNRWSSDWSGTPS
jgi:serine protease AprX